MLSILIALHWLFARLTCPRGAPDAKYTNHWYAVVRTTPRKLDRLCVLVCVVAGAASYWRFRDSPWLDDVSYLDIADAYVRRDWAHAVNAYWSPLFSWIVAGTRAILRPAPQWDMMLLGAVSFVFFCIALLAFRSFWRQMNDADDPVMTVLGYALFLWGVMGIVHVSAQLLPDIGVVAVILLAADRYLRIRKSPRLVQGIVLGLILGIGYLQKAVLLPLGLILVAMIFILEPPARKAAAAAFVTIFACAAPWIAVVSLHMHRLTFSEAGRLNYAWCVDGIGNSMCSDEAFLNWYDDPGLSGYPTHPAVIVHTRPRVIDYSGMAGTYPPWYDPAWWFDGLQVHFSARKQLRTLGVSFHYLADAFFETGASVVVLAGCIGLVFAAERRPRLARPVLFLWSISGFCMYSLVYIEWRHIAGFAVLLASVLYSELWKTARSETRIGVGAVVVSALAASLLIPIPAYTVQGARDTFTGRIFPPEYEAARGLQSLGVHPGDRVALIGSDTATFVARFGRFRFVSEVQGEDLPIFWSEDEQQQEDVFRVMASTGAGAVLSDQVPIDQRDRWECLQDTPYCIRLLRSN